MAAPAAPGVPPLTDVVAYVEVWSANRTENYSKTFTNQLVAMGAKVSKTFNKQVTHVVFKDGYQSTWDKAQKKGVKLVSVLWVEKCRTAGVHVDEALFPAVNTPARLPLLSKKKHKCMQPKDFIPRTPESDKRLQRKFEKMANELQRQRTALDKQRDDDRPALLFDSDGSLTYSPTVKMYSGQHSAMEKRLQEMKEKRENLSPTSSQMIEKSYDDPVNSSCKASLNISHDTSCSDEPFSSVQHLSFDDLCGNSGCGSQERGLGGFAAAVTSDAQGSWPAPRASDAGPWPSPRRLRPLTAPESAGDPSKGEGHEQQGPVGGVITTVPSSQKPSQGVSEETSDEKEKDRPCPVFPAAKGHHGGQSQPRSSSVKRKRAPALSDPPRQERPDKQRSRRPPSWDPRPRESEGSVAAPALQTLGGESSYDDYFSPDNLEERGAETGPGLLPSPGPAPPGHRAHLSKRGRAGVLATCDLSCIGRDPGTGDVTGWTSKASFALQRQEGDVVGTAAGHVVPAEAPRCQDGGGVGPAGSSSPPGATEPVWSVHGAPRGQADEPPAGPSRGHTEEPVGPEAMQREDAVWSMSCPSAGAKRGPAARDALEGPRGGCRRLASPREESGERRRGRKPTRTLVMTSMPSEKQLVVIQVVDKLKGFSLAPGVCDSTTHVLAGGPRRTLNVLLGLARGCWVLAFEWVLWSLELGHWISEEPFELSDTFPAAPLCRLERHRGTLGTLFAAQPPMFVSPDSDPPQARLWELVRLSGGRPTHVLRHAGICIGPPRGKRRASVAYLSEKWILDSITRHEVCAFENYLLRP